MPDSPSAGPRMINRSVAIISPKVPFLEWAQRSYRNAAPPPGMPSQPRAFLIPQAASDQDGRDYVLVECAGIFAAMLANWNRDPATWPDDLDSCPLFTAWFDVQIVLAVGDLVLDEGIA